MSFPVPGNPPRYRKEGPCNSCSYSFGYCIEDPATRQRWAIIPDLAEFTDDVLEALWQCDAVFLDGTFWSNEELMQTGAGSLTAKQMGHLPIGGEGGSLKQFARLPASLKVYVHINNTNPVLRESSLERRTVEAAGILVGVDHQEFVV
jgi:pyrroloquinoline quinone biosynthesis protein B